MNLGGRFAYTGGASRKPQSQFGGVYFPEPSQPHNNSQGQGHTDNEAESRQPQIQLNLGSEEHAWE